MDSHNFTHVLQVFQLKGLHHIHNVIIPTFNISVEYVFGQWTKWSNCSKECGPGDKTRTRNCIDKAYDDEAKIVSILLNFLYVFITFLFFQNRLWITANVQAGRVFLCVLDPVKSKLVQEMEVGLTGKNRHS